MKEIPLTQNKISIVDDEDYDFLKGKLWHANKSKGTYYAETNRRSIVKGLRSGDPLGIHTALMNPPPGHMVDHLNGNGLDNRRGNLRIIPTTGNYKRILQTGWRPTKYQGVHYDHKSNKWISSIRDHHRCVVLGRYDTQVEAALAHDKAAMERRRGLAVLNFRQPEVACPVVALHGLQGSAKSSVAEFLSHRLALYGFNVVIQNVKSSFVQPAEEILAELLKSMESNAYLRSKEVTIETRKQLYLALSTWGERFLDPMIWSSLFMEKLKYSKSHWSIADDIRTEMNIKALIQLSEHRPVYLLRLLASESVRRERVSIWRENGGYTEVLQPKPDKLPPNFIWVDINTELPRERVQYEILKVLFGLSHEPLKMGNATEMPKPSIIKTILSKCIYGSDYAQDKN